MTSRVVHLARRTWLSIVDSEVSDADLLRVREMLDDSEHALWLRMSPVDQRHSVRVVDRFIGLLPDASRTERAAVLLHDVGKMVSQLGTTTRILATLGLLRTRRARDYRRHEAIGADLARDAGVSSLVIESMTGRGRREFREAFRLADEE